MYHYHLVQGDCLQILPQLEAESVDLIITSPPYNLQMEYEEKLSKEKYLDFIKSVLEECFRVLRRGGRVCWNVPNQIRVGRDGELWAPAIKTAGLMEEIGYSFFDFIIWDQGYSDSATAWGSWCSPSAPFIRHQTEAILVFFKGVWKIQRRGETDLNPKEFMSLTKGELWRMNPERDRSHPAPFPEELPRRCIRLFSYLGGTILDPFLGSGTTMKVAQELGRSCIGIELNEDYYEKARRRCWGRQFLTHQVEYHSLATTARDKNV